LGEEGKACKRHKDSERKLAVSKKAREKAVTTVAMGLLFGRGCLGVGGGELWLLVLVVVDGLWALD
jgi:hypothetical protein